MTVVVEVKGCWHRELLTAMRGQLAEQYLSPHQRHGIYLAVWFGAANWDEDGDNTRHRACTGLNPDDILEELSRQADELVLRASRSSR